MSVGPLIIVSGPAGSGKSTLIGMALREFGPRLRHSVSATTRERRKGEVDGVHYHFWTRQRFEAGIKAGEFLEYATVFGEDYYGTPRSEVEPYRNQGIAVILDIDVQGARQFKAVYPESVLIFLLPPSAEALMKRLNSRQTESGDAFRTRVRAAREELRAAVSYQYAVVNDDLESAYRIVSSIVDAEAVRHARQPHLTARVNALVEELDRHLVQLSTPA